MMTSLDDKLSMRVLINQQEHVHPMYSSPSPIKRFKESNIAST